jgi:prefoldin subunit 5
MDNNEYKNPEDKINGLISELDEFISKLRAQMDILKQADMELDNAFDQLDADLGFWDTAPKKIPVSN